MARACQVALQRVDVILVAALVSTTAAAVYTAATRFIALGQLVNQAIQQVIQPRLAALLSRHRNSEAQHVVRQSTLWLTTLAWPGYLGLVVLAPLLMSIFGSAYVAGASGVVVLALAMMAATAAGPVDVVLLMAGRSGASLASVVVALVVDVVGCLLLLPVAGDPGCRRGLGRGDRGPQHHHDPAGEAAGRDHRVVERAAPSSARSPWRRWRSSRCRS